MTIEKNSRFASWINGCDYVMMIGVFLSIFFLPITGAVVEGAFVLMLLAHFVKRFFIFAENLALSRTTNKIKIFLQSFKPQASPLNKALGIYVLAAFLSVVFSVDIHLSIKGFVFKLLQGVYTYLIFVEVISTKRRLNIFNGIFLASIALIVVNGFVQHFRGYDFIHGYTWWDGRLVSSFKHSNDFGAYLIVVIMFLLGLTYHFLSAFLNGNLKTEKEALINKLFLCALVVLLFGAIYCLGLTFSRGAWLGFFIALVCFGFYKNKCFFIVPMGLIIVFLFLFYPMMRMSRNVSFTTDRVKKITLHVERQPDLVKADLPEAGLPKTDLPEKNNPPVKQAVSLEHCQICQTILRKINKVGSGRMDFWHEAINIIHDYPVFGTGLNTYSIVARKYKINWGGYPHNCYLQIAAEMGIVGLLSFLWIIGVFIKTALKSLAKKTYEFWDYMGLGLFCGLIGFFIHAAFDTTFYSVQLDSYLWLMLGAYMSSYLLGASSGLMKN